MVNQYSALSGANEKAVKPRRFDARRSFMKQLQEFGVELDQRMRRALEMYPLEPISDDVLFLALYKLNSVVSRHFDFHNIIDPYDRSPRQRPIERLRTSASPCGHKVFNRALELVGEGKTLGVYHFVKAIVQLAFEGKTGWDTPYTLHAINEALGIGLEGKVSDSPRVRSFLDSLNRSLDGAEDFQYLLALEGDRIVFRVASLLDDYVQLTESGLFLQHRALLTHFRDQFGGFTPDEIEGLIELLNSRTAQERDFQTFFERHPHFLRRWDYREVHPHVYLSHGREPLVPDFILTDRSLQRAVVLELKLPTPRLIRRQQNRDRFATALMEARAQLLRYRDWFRESYNRETLKRVVGMEIYEPHLAVIIGRNSEFQDDFDRQRLVSDVGDIEVVTYDDIVTFAERRRMIIKWDTDSPHITRRST